jgi:hypothetical protein
MDGWMDGCMDGWMGGWIHIHTYSTINVKKYLVQSK